MGQLFDAIVYDIETRKCLIRDVDKFHANCYSYSGVIISVHYLLRNGPYHVMWCGDYVCFPGYIDSNLFKEELLGISVSKNSEDFDNDDDDDDDDDDDNNDDDDDKKEKNKKKSNNHNNLKFIDENHNTWKDIDVQDKALNYFGHESVKYDGYLINHSKKQAIDLKKYYLKSLLLNRNYEKYVIDLIPCLTETGGGTEMALFDGCSKNVTEKLIGTWCGDLLEIVDQCPENYKMIKCCFASINERVRYCIKYFGSDEEKYVLKNKNGKKFEGIKLLPFTMERSKPFYVKK